MIARARSFARRGASAYARAFRRASNNARRYLLAVSLQNVAMGLLGTVFAIYVRERGLSVSVVGDSEGALALGAAVVCLLLPPLVSVVGYRSLLLTAAFAYGAARLLQVLGFGAGGIVALGLLYGVGDGIMRSVGVAFLSESGETTDRTMLFTIDFVLRIAAGVAGALLGGALPLLLGLWLTPLVSLRIAIVLAGALFVVSAVPLSRLRERARGPVRATQGYLRAVRGFRSWDRLLRLAVPEALVSFGAGLVMPFVPLLLKNGLGANVGQVGVIQGVTSVLMALATLATPLLVRRTGLVGTIVLTELASLPFLLVIPLAGSLPLVALAMWLRGALMNMSWPIYNQIAVEGIPPRDKPLVTGWMSVAWSVAWLGGSVLGGRLNEHSYTTPYFVTAALYAVGAGCSWLLLRHVRAEAPAPSLAAEVVESPA